MILRKEHSRVKHAPLPVERTAPLSAESVMSSPRHSGGSTRPRVGTAIDALPGGHSEPALNVRKLRGWGMAKLAIPTKDPTSRNFFSCELIRFLFLSLTISGPGSAENFP